MNYGFLECKLMDSSIGLQTYNRRGVKITRYIHLYDKNVDDNGLGIQTFRLLKPNWRNNYEKHDKTVRGANQQPNIEDR